MVTSTISKPDRAPFIRPTPKHLDPELIQPQILQDIRVSDMNLPSIILKCSLNGKRVININENLKKFKYVPIDENRIAQIYSKESYSDLREVGSVKCGRKVELIYFTINKETQEITDIKRDNNDYILLKAKNFQDSLEEEMSRELFFLKKYEKQPGILPIIAKYSYMSKSQTKKIQFTTKNAIIMRRLQDLFTSITDRRNQLKLSSSKQQRDFFKKEAKKQLLEAVLAIHNQGDVHRDLKLENALWEKVDDTFKFYIIDFGTTLTHNELDKVDSLAGTAKYSDPQILFAMYKARQCEDKDKKQEIYTEATNQKNDIFSLGLMFYLLQESTHKLPIDILTLMNENAKFPHVKPDLENLSSKIFFRDQTQDQHLFKIGSFEHLVWRMLRPNPEERISAQEAYEELSRINSETK